MGGQDFSFVWCRSRLIGELNAHPQALNGSDGWTIRRRSFPDPWTRTMLSEPNGLPTDGDDPEAALHSRPFFPLSFPSFRLSFIPPSPSVSLETLVPPSPPHASVVFQDPLLLLPRSRQIAETPNFMAAALDPAGGALGLLVLFALISPSARVGVFSRPDKETREKFYGNLVKGESRNSSGEGSIAEIFDRVLEKEFSENDAPEGKGFVPLIKIILLVSVWLHCGFVIAARSCTKDF